MSREMVSGLTCTPGMRATMWMGIHQRAMDKSLERLATGKRVNHASDDPAAIPVIDSLKAQRISIEKRLQRIEVDQHYVGARDGLASVVGDQLIELKGLVVQAANTGGMSQDEIRAIQDNADSILSGIDFLANTYTFGDAQIGQAYSTATLGIAGLRSGAGYNLVNGDLEAAGSIVDNAISNLNGSRATIGASLQSSEAERKSLQEELIQLTQSQSMIEDTDYAKETGEFVRAQALHQVATFISQLASKQSANTVLALVQGAGVGMGVGVR